MSTLVGAGHEESTWKVDDWLENDRPEIIVYEDTTARSDHDSFQRNLGTVTMGFGGLVDGYWCYHQTCDTLEEMEEWMDISVDEGVKFFLTSLGKPGKIVAFAERHGVKVYHDVHTPEVARKVADEGVAGLNCLNSSMGGQTGNRSVFTLTLT